MSDFKTEVADLNDGRDQHNLMCGLVPEAEYGKQLGKSARTCQRDRQRGVAPPHVHVGRRVYYRIAAVRDWLIQREQPGSQMPSGSRWRKVHRRMGGRP